MNLEEFREYVLAEREQQKIANAKKVQKVIQATVKETK